MTPLDGQMLDVDPARLRDPKSEQPQEAGLGVVDGAARSTLRDEGPELHAIESQVVDSVSIFTQTVDYT